MTLFRSEAIKGQRRGLIGDITVHQPTSLRLVTTGLVSLAVGAIAATSIAKFERKETALGWVVPEKGLAEIYAQPGGLLQALDIRVGDYVRKGQSLGAIATETYGSSGSFSRQGHQQIASVIAETDAQIIAARERGEREAAKAQEQIWVAQLALTSLAEQRDLQSTQVQLLQKQFDDAEDIVRKGFISKFEQDKRRQSILSGRQSLSAVNQQIREQKAQLVILRTAQKNALSQAAVEQSQLRASLANLRTTDMNISEKSGSMLRAPVNGVVAAVNMRVGEAVKGNLPVVSIAPIGRLGIELLMPTRSSGFISRGQTVRVFVDAFPFQRYGALTGKVEQISRAPVMPQEYMSPVKFELPSYRVFVRLDQQAVRAYGKIAPLQTGMTITASVVAERRTLLQWLFDPILAARGKMT